VSVTKCDRSRVHGLRQRRPGRRTWLAILSVVCVALAASACGSNSTKPSAATTSTGPDLTYFKGKTITLIAPDNPGGSFDQWSRLIAPAMSTYLHATVNVENIPPGNTVVGQNTLASSAPNGLTIGWLNAIEDVSFSITGGSSGLNFNPVKEDMIAAPGQNISVWVTDPSSSYTSWKSIVDSRTPVGTLDVTSGTADLYLRAIYGAYGVNAKIITGYESSKLLAAGFLRHDAPVAEEEFTVFSDAISAHEARPVLITTPASASDPGTKSLLKVPTIADVAKDDPPKTAKEKAALQEVISLVNLPGNILTAPRGTPAGELAALEAAAHYALNSSSVKAQAATEGLTPGYFSGQACLLGYKSALTHIDLLKPYMSSS
jgi:tripartite-type tricarboxylate transporter receptor subunit TctC